MAAEGPPTTTRFLVSVESLAVPARAAVLKSLQTRLGLVPVADHERGGSSLQLLLHRLLAVTRSRQNCLLSGSWVLKVPHDPIMRKLHHDLARAVCDTAPVAAATTNVCHILVCLRTCPDEAFEELIECDHPVARDVTHRCLREAQHVIDSVAAGAGACSPFPTRVVVLDCPCFAADNPAELKKLVDLAYRECTAAMTGRTPTA